MSDFPDCGNIDDSFGPRVDAALEAFQRSRGLSPDRIVGPATRGQLNAIG